MGIPVLWGKKGDVHVEGLFTYQLLDVVGALVFFFSVDLASTTPPLLKYMHAGERNRLITEKSTVT